MSFLTEKLIWKKKKKLLRRRCTTFFLRFPQFGGSRHVPPKNPKTDFKKK